VSLIKDIAAYPDCWESSFAIRKGAADRPCGLSDFRTDWFAEPAAVFSKSSSKPISYRRNSCNRTFVPAPMSAMPAAVAGRRT